MIPRFLALAAGTAVLFGCSAMSRIANEDSPRSGDIGNAVVVDDDDLQTSRGGLLTILQNHVRGMSVARDNACPHVVLRGGVGRSPAAEVLVYVDGQRVSDTCILDLVNVDNLARAEVYPGGVTTRPGYSSNAGGLILLFMKDGRSAQIWQ